MAKYEPLEHYLCSRRMSEVPMTFGEIERVIGNRLPPAARAHRAWWSNNPSNNVMTKSWLAAGFVSERVDLAGERLVFRRSSGTPSSPAGTDAPSPGLLERIRARLGGTVTVAPGVDLMEPLWEAEEGEV